MGSQGIELGSTRFFRCTAMRVIRQNRSTIWCYYSNFDGNPVRGDLWNFHWQERCGRDRRRCRRCRRAEGIVGNANSLRISIINWAVGETNRMNNIRK
jgi:hypothetical protein